MAFAERQSMRMFVASLATETNTFSPLPADRGLAVSSASASSGRLNPPDTTRLRAPLARRGGLGVEPVAELEAKRDESFVRVRAEPRVARVFLRTFHELSREAGNRTHRSHDVRARLAGDGGVLDRKSTRLNSSHRT